MDGPVTEMRSDFIVNPIVEMWSNGRVLIFENKISLHMLYNLKEPILKICLEPSLIKPLDILTRILRK